MKLPAVGIAAALAGGILLGLYLSLHKADSLRVAVLFMLAVAVVAWVVSAVFLRYDSLCPRESRHFCCGWPWALPPV
jgi:hypothetical protein